MEVWIVVQALAGQGAPQVTAHATPELAGEAMRGLIRECCAEDANQEWRALLRASVILKSGGGTVPIGDTSSITLTRAPVQTAAEPAQGEREVWSGQIPNWLALAGDHVRPGTEAVPARVVINRGYGGVSIVLDSPEGEKEVHVEMSNVGPTVRVYVPNRDAPAIYAPILADGLGEDLT